ncbi:MAG: LuxR C-terminal-related transcriptional regulator [Myxococcota bacterium]|jgi:DNA-binding CsgD family transcriptional regulator|nr:LuxR C-terminal-related transcriptional regulator [Myxococcota bacterium]
MRSAPPTLDRDDLFKISQLWVSQGNKPLHRPLDVLFHFFDGLCALTEAHTAFAVVTLKDNQNPTLQPKDDPLNGWRAKELIIFRGSAEERMIGIDYMNDNSYMHDEPTIANMQQAGKHRVHLIREFLEAHGDMTREQLNGKKLLDDLGLGDRLVGAHALCPSAEFFIGLDRLQGYPLFDVRERDLLFEVIRGMRPLVTRLFMSYGRLPGQTSLTPREQETLHFLLDGLSEKEVGEQMQITPASAHQYAVSIYRKLGVNSRAQLLNLWLNPPTEFEV